MKDIIARFPNAKPYWVRDMRNGYVELLTAEAPHCQMSSKDARLTCEALLIGAHDWLVAWIESGERGHSWAACGRALAGMQLGVGVGWKLDPEKDAVLGALLNEYVAENFRPIEKEENAMGHLDKPLSEEYLAGFLEGQQKGFIDGYDKGVLRGRAARDADDAILGQLEELPAGPGAGHFGQHRRRRTAAETFRLGTALQKVDRERRPYPSAGAGEVPDHVVRVPPYMHGE